MSLKYKRDKRHKDHLTKPTFQGLTDPNHCRLPVRGGLCPEHLLTQTDRNGKLILWCRVHGERPADITRPPNFERYGARDRLEAELTARVTRSQSKALPSHHTPKIKDIGVIGYVLARKLEVL